MEQSEKSFADGSLTRPPIASFLAACLLRCYGTSLPQGLRSSRGPVQSRRRRTKSRTIQSYSRFYLQNHTLLDLNTFENAGSQLSILLYARTPSLPRFLSIPNQERERFEKTTSTTLDECELIKPDKTSKGCYWSPPPFKSLRLKIDSRCCFIRCPLANVLSNYHPQKW